MKITINHSESGLFKTKYVVELKVELSPEERTILDQRKLWKTTVYVIPWIEWFNGDAKQAAIMEQFQGPQGRAVTIKDFLNEKRTFGTPIEAKAYDEALRTEHLPTLKAFIEGNKEPGKASDTFEL
jgi:hypothetical protein